MSGGGGGGGYVSKKRDARTTQRQYELMLDFMIKHPDIASGRHANTKRANYEKHWEELANVLNSDTAGPSKATTKWMKCWSDWKHNTRTKSAKIRQFKETPADGRFPCLLTTLEERLLKLMASFKNDTNDNYALKQDGFDGYVDYETDLGNWFSQVQYNIKKEREELPEDEEIISEESSDDGQPFNTADFCIPVIDQEDDSSVPNVEIKPSNGLSSAISIEAWKKRKRLYSDTSSHSDQDMNHSEAKIINIDTRPPSAILAAAAAAAAAAVASVSVTPAANTTVSAQSGGSSSNTYIHQQQQQQQVNRQVSDNYLLHNTLSRIAVACEQSAQANERCAAACERMANLCERLQSTCERTANSNEKLLTVQERSTKIQERTFMSTEQLQKSTERQVANTDQLVGIVQSVAEQSIDVIKRYITNQNSIRR